MKGVSTVRKIDVLGRIVLPFEFRKRIDFKRGYEVEMFVTNGITTIKKYKRGCMFCGREKILITYRGFKVCMSCVSILELMKVEGQRWN